MNPYEETSEENQDNFPSLDSLFEDDEPSTPTVEKNSNSFSSVDTASNISNMKEEPVSSPVATATMPEAPKKNNKKDTTEIDIQKELEAKFDELFGALDDDDDSNI